MMRLLLRCCRVVLAVVATASVAAAAPQKPGAPAPPSNDDCLACHGDAGAVRADGRSVAVAPETFAGSIHGMGGLACVDCHADLATLAEYPHAEKLQPAQCATCHDAAVAAYDTGVHAQARRAGGNLSAAACADCHGSHDIKPSADPTSRTHHARLLDTCGRCHGNEAIIKRGKIEIGNVVDLFRDSIHGKALIKSGLSVAPTCTDCHGSHDIRGKTDPASKVFRKTIPGDLQQLPRGHRPRVLGERPRGAGGEGQPPRAGLHELPHGARDPPVGRGGLEARGHQGVRHLPRAVARDLPRHVPRPGDGARVRARGVVRRLPRRARHLPEGGPAVDGVRRQPGGDLPAVPRRARRRASRSTIRTPTPTTASGTRCCSTPRSS